MTLDEYLFSVGRTVKEFAEFIGYAPTYLINVKNGDRKASERMKELVKLATDGKVEL